MKMHEKENNSKGLEHFHIYKSNFFQNWNLIHIAVNFNLTPIKFDPRLPYKVNGDTLQPKASHTSVSVHLVSAYPHKTFLPPTEEKLNFYQLKSKQKAVGLVGTQMETKYGKWHNAGTKQNYKKAFATFEQTSFSNGPEFLVGTYG